MEAKQVRLIQTVVRVIAVIAIGMFVKFKTAETHAPMWVAAGWLLTGCVVVRVAMVLRRAVANAQAQIAAAGKLDVVDVA
jgi:hypothetical protein